MEQKADWLLARMETMVKRLKIPTDLRRYGVTMEALDELVASGMAVQRLLVNNKREVTPADARTMYLELLESKEG